MTVARLCASLCVAAWIGGAGASQPAPSAELAGPAYLLIQLPSKRVVAESRPDVLGAPILPGSVIKVATLIAALEKGVVDETTRIACRRTVTVDGRTLTCVHPDLHRSLTASEALGYSCNSFFASVAERLPRAALDDVLVRMGIGPSDGSAPTALVALGLAGLRPTPRKLLDGFIKVTGPASSFRMSDQVRATVTGGLRLAATVGTASALGAAGIPALAKTGTAPMAGGGYHGVLVATTTDSDPGYAIIVVVPGGAGSDAAAVAADVLARSHVVPTKSAAATAALPLPDRDRPGLALRRDQPAEGMGEIRVGISRRGGGYDRVSLSLESYVARVVAGEAPPGMPLAALEALAITVRTFAAANRGRHASEGFDFCDLTHCQVLGTATAEAERATQSTIGLVLRDNGRVASVFYSAWCGGHTEAPSHVWAGASDPAYLRARTDLACLNAPGWTSDIAEPQLRRALEAAGLRGSVVRGFVVASRYPSGRVATLRVDGMAPDRIDANHFQLAAGRVLGWQIVKSTMFDVRRSSTGFVLSGRGVGHGVGLCLRGAAARAVQGRSRAEILAAYFPGLHVGALSNSGSAGAGAGTIGPGPLIRVMLPEADRDRLDEVRALADRQAHAMSLSLGVALPPVVELRFHATVEAFARATGQPWWAAARTTGARIDLLPLEVLRKRGILELTLRHELVHVLTDSILAGRPLWVREGLAVVKAGELPAATAADRSALRPDTRGGDPVIACPADAEFRRADSGNVWRNLYAAAGRCVDRALASGTRWQDLR